MDESAGPTAFDSSGNGLNGQFQPNTVFGQVGPESGTNAIGSGSVAAGVIRNGLPVFGLVPLSLVCWYSESIFNGPNSSPDLMYAGNNAPARGFGSLMNPSNGIPSWVYKGLLVSNTTLVATAGAWHMLAVTWDTPAGGTATYQIDLGARQTLTGHSYSNTFSTDQVAILTPAACLLAHFALYNFALSNAQAQSIFNGATLPLTTPTPTGRTATDFDIAACEDLLRLIYAAVHRDFPTT